MSILTLSVGFFSLNAFNVCESEECIHNYSPHPHYLLQGDYIVFSPALSKKTISLPTMIFFYAVRLGILSLFPHFCLRFPPTRKRKHQSSTYFLVFTCLP